MRLPIVTRYVKTSASNCSDVMALKAVELPRLISEMRMAKQNVTATALTGHWVRESTLDIQVEKGRPIRRLRQLLDFR